MSAYGEVLLHNNSNMSAETIVEDNQMVDSMDSQVEKFDNNYSISNEKLQELYNQYDKITIDEEKIKSLTQVKTNAVSTAVPFRVKLVLTTSIVVMLLLAFLCIYNITVINGMTSSINTLQEEVISCEENLTSSKGLFESLTSLDNIQSELTSMGYTDMASSNIVTIEVPQKSEVIQLHGETNWFDAFCNFLSRIFG